MIQEVAELKNFCDSLFRDRAEFVYLLGSFGTDRVRQDSDVDLAVFWKVDPNLDDKAEF